MSNYSTCLVDLYLSFNHLTGSIPNVFGNMSSLAHVDLYDNQLEGAEPHSFSTLCSLQSLDLSGNNLSGQFSRFVQILPTCAQNSLESLRLYGNQLAGPLPDFTNFLSLKELYIPYNQLSGRIPESIGQMSKLELIDLGMNALEGLISESHFSELSKLSYLDLSSNSLVLNFQSNWTPPFQLDYISLGSCKMGPYFPKWLQTQNEYSSLNISNAGIVDILPSWFWGTTRNARSISLSHNQIGEMFTNLTMDFANYPEVHLSSNQIEGSISFLCASAATHLSFLNLSYNYLSGELPKCLTHLGNLVMLDLSSNALSGKIPSTIGSLFGIETLKLRSNEFVGELPLSLKNCTSLVVLDLADNQLSGSIPKWLGASFQNLVILMLSSNHFNGSLPLQLCDLIYIQILDVSVNNISGGIPNCLKKLTTLAQKGNSSLTVGHSYAIYTDQHLGQELIYEDDEIFIWKGSMQVYRNTLGLVRSIDFSSNRLTGEIPREISHLVGLVSLNLSRNQLTGQITPDIGKLESLDSLDLSRNHIDGRIPTSLARISRLGVLDLSHNNLIGKIPTGTQLQSFDPSFYDGNPQLCGPPLKKPCDIEETGPDQVRNEEDKDGQLIRYGFYISMGLGFFVGFWGVCGSLIFIREWRYTYFKFLNSLNDWLYVRVVLIKRKLTDA
ncbi:receptor-like protein EIX2 [Malus sylvestris]|uniref:receptor-like protein EIX2 n=1 Tax=Malus sylvestris TaxID=3752 RepID=UPI0021ACCFA9|nr:receptor-like protein EIX2 [Malus sylvestris]XP_050157608.1 receptor-like protein EIX2 [Malus sylvestris]